MKELNTEQLMNINGGAHGYVSSRYLDFGPVDRSDYGLATVDLEDSNSYLNVRSEPSTSASIVGKLHDGDQVTTKSSRNTKRGWSYIIY